MQRKIRGFSPVFLKLCTSLGSTNMTRALASTFYLNRIESNEGTHETKVSVPLFAIVFMINSLICAGLNSFTVNAPVLGSVWMWIQAALKSSMISFLLAISFAGVGSKVKFRDIAKVGIKPFGFAALMSIVAGVLALGMAILIAPYVA